MPEPLQGRCLCGACRFTAAPEELQASICHCGQCNRWTGGMFVAVYCGDTIVFEDGAPLGSYKGSAWGERLFCKECGASMVWQTQDGAHQSASIHCFEDPSRFTLTSQIFVDRKPSCYGIANDTDMMTEAEVMAKYAGGND